MEMASEDRPSGADSWIWWMGKPCYGRQSPWPALPLDSNWPGKSQKNWRRMVFTLWMRGGRLHPPQNRKGGVIKMTNRIPIQRCQYCGCEDIGLGWQHGEALVTFKKHGMMGNRLQYLICRRCGAVLYQCVAEPYRFPPVR